jgi:hypothetical protein
MPRRPLEDICKQYTVLALRRLPNAADNALLFPMLPCRARLSHLRPNDASLANKDFTDDLLTEGL